MSTSNARSILLPGLLFFCAVAQPLSARTAADPSLLAEIARIKIIDNHAHVLRLVGEGEKADDEYDALPCPEIGAQEPDVSAPVRLRPDNPEYIAAWRALYGYAHNDS